MKMKKYGRITNILKITLIIFVVMGAQLFYKPKHASAITLTATGNIDPQLTFTLTNTTLYFGSLTVGTARCATTTPTPGGGSCPTAPAGTANFSVSTNGVGGNVITIQDANNGLKGVAYPSSIITATSAASAATTKFYSYGVITTPQSGFSLDPGFNGATGNVAISSGGHTFASSTGPMDAAVGYIEFGSVIAATTISDTYADTVTIICTGQY